MEFSYRAIGVIRSPYRQKFATPRQPNLVSEAEAEILFEDGFDHRDCMRGLEQFSHLWLLWHFHQTSELGCPAGATTSLGRQTKAGVFASRSPFRPNPIGLSVVRNLGAQTTQSQLTLRVGGIDLVDATPILDIKPYIVYADAILRPVQALRRTSPVHAGMSISPIPPLTHCRDTNRRIPI